MNAPTLQMLIDMAQTASHAAQGHRVRVQGEVDAARTQLDMLVRFRADYAQRAQAQLRSGCDAAANANQMRFAQRLEQAALAQMQDLRNRERALAAAEDEVRDAERKLKSLQALAARQAEQQRLLAQRLDQKQTDEAAQAIAARTPPFAAGT